MTDQEGKKEETGALILALKCLLDCAHETERGPEHTAQPHMPGTDRGGQRETDAGASQDGKTFLGRGGTRVGPGRIAKVSVGKEERAGFSRVGMVKGWIEPKRMNTQEAEKVGRLACLELG